MSQGFGQIILETVGFCNLRCRMCPTRHYGPEFKVRMEEEVFEKVAECFRPGMMVNLTGWGEPLLDKALEERIKRAREKGAQVVFSTNGVLLNRRRARAILETGLYAISFSLDAATDETYLRIRHYDFRVVRRNIENFLEIRAREGFETLVDLSFVVMKLNFAEMGPFLELARAWGVDSVAFTPRFLLFSRRDYEETYVSALEVEEAVDRLYQPSMGFELRVFGFGAYPTEDCFASARTTLFVSARGEVSPCCILGHRLPRYHPREEHPRVFYRSFGNLTGKPLEEIWEGEDYRRFRETLAQGRAPSPCQGCHLLPKRLGFLG